ncbi:MAG: hypothetical protein H8D45_06650 [Bacteroidetes bacterium]|nr:hypothetical protein [Bacteroidota bacterium]
MPQYEKYLYQNKLPNFLKKIICPNCKNIRISRKDRCNQDLCKKCFPGIILSKRIDKEKLEKLYIIQNITSRGIAEKLNTTHRSVLNWLEYYNIPKHDVKWKIENNRYAGYWKDKKISQEVRNKISITRIEREVAKGNKNPMWKGGISDDPYCNIWKDKEYKESIKERDGYQCMNPDCWKTSKNLRIHHIDYNKKNCDPWNLITLCVSCNVRANIKRKEWKYLYREIIYFNYNHKEGVLSL